MTSIGAVQLWTDWLACNIVQHSPPVCVCLDHARAAKFWCRVPLHTIVVPTRWHSRLCRAALHRPLVRQPTDLPLMRRLCLHDALTGS